MHWSPVRTRSGPLWAAAWVLLAAVSAARGDVVDDRAQDIVDALRRGDVQAAVSLLEDPSLTSDLADRPALVHVLCDRAYRFDDACAAAPPTSRMLLATVLMEVAEDTRASAAEDPRAAWALANALVLRERSGLAQGAASWLRAADLLVEAHAATPGAGEALGYAVTFLVEGAALAEPSRHELLKRAGAIATDLRRKHRDAVGSAAMVASAQLWAARTFLADDRRAAKAAVGEVFDCLRPFTRKGDDVAADTAALWNAAVTIGLERRYALREGYVTRTASALSGALLLDVPVSPQWTVTEVPETEDADAYVYVTQTDAEGETLRQILFRSYQWGLLYPFDGPNDVNGDNVKGLARGLQAISLERVFGAAARTAAPKKGKFGDGISGYQFSISGLTAGEEGRALSLHGYCGRGGRQSTHVVLIYVYAEGGALDVETEALLASIREPDA